MIKNGIFLNIIIDIIICLVSLVFLHSLYKIYHSSNKYSRPSLLGLMAIWGLLSCYFIIDAARLAVASFGNAGMQLNLYILSLIPLTLISLPIVFIIIYIISGNKYIGTAVSSIFIIFIVLYIVTIIQLENFIILDTAYGPIVYTGNTMPTLIFLSGLFIVPTSMMLGLLGVILLRHISMLKKYKICLSILSISLVYDFLFLITISQTVETIIASKIFIFLGIVLGYYANFPPKIIESKCVPQFTIIE